MLKKFGFRSMEARRIELRYLLAVGLRLWRPSSDWAGASFLELKSISIKVRDPRLGLVSDLGRDERIGRCAGAKKKLTTHEIELAAYLLPSSAVVTRKQRWVTVEASNVVATDAVATRVTSVVMAARRRTPAIVVIVIPRRGGSGYRSSKQRISAVGRRGRSTRPSSDAGWGQRSIRALGASDPQRDAEPFRSAER